MKKNQQVQEILDTEHSSKVYKIKISGYDTLEQVDSLIAGICSLGIEPLDFVYCGFDGVTPAYSEIGQTVFCSRYEHLIGFYPDDDTFDVDIPQSAYEYVNTSVYSIPAIAVYNRAFMELETEGTSTYAYKILSSEALFCVVLLEW